MARNIEIKARLENLNVQLGLARTLCQTAGELIHQVDYFFPCRDGRLKLRVFDDGTGELIFYRRSDQAGPKLSDYVLAPTAEPDRLRDALDGAYGIDAIVEKNRTLFLHGRTRIHLDRVKNLGEFLELEVVLGDGQRAAGQREIGERETGERETGEEESGERETGDEEISDGSVGRARREAEALMQTLQIDASSLIDCAYVDLLSQHR